MHVDNFDRIVGDHKQAGACRIPKSPCVPILELPGIFRVSVLGNDLARGPANQCAPAGNRGRSRVDVAE